MTFAKDALGVLNGAEVLLVDQGAMSARLPTMLYKVATLSAASRRSAIVETLDAAGAVQVVLRWQKGAANLLPFLKRKTMDAEFALMCQEVLDIIDEAGGTLHRQHIASRLRLRKLSLDALLGTLVDWGEVTVDATSGTVVRKY